MFGMMSGKRLAVKSNRMYPIEEVLKSSIRGTQSDIGALASKDSKSAAVMVWNYHDDDKSGPTEMVNLTIENIPAKKVALNIFLIDKENSNSYEVWKKMGSPQNPTQQQIEILEKSGKLKCISTKKIKINSAKTIVPLKLERQAVALVKLDW
jgi:xylan 1,4-beta-xylosidase